jgi:hypothetical protein
LQDTQRIDGIARADRRLDTRGDDAATIGDRGGAGQSIGERRHAVPRLQYVARRDDEPDLIQPQTAPGEFRDVQVARMRRVEGPAQQADSDMAPVAEAGNRIGKRHANQVRTWPLPRTR